MKLLIRMRLSFMAKQTSTFSKFRLLVVAFFSFYSIVFAQEPSKKQSLISVLKHVESQFGYQFNYAQDLVEDYQIVPPSKNLTFNETITYLKSITGLDYKRVDSYILVSNIEGQSNAEVKLQELPEVVIPSYIIEGISKLNSGAFKIDFSKFRMLPGLIEADVLQSVKAFPGIQSINENVSNINIRGGSHDQNLILWDGIKMYQSGHFFGLISMYNPQITQDVLLLKNGSGVDFTDGVSGTIAMQTNTEINKKLKGNLGVNFIDANGFLDVPISKKSSIQIALRKSISDFVQTPAYRNFFDKISEDTEIEDNKEVVNTDEKFDFYDLSFRWLYKFNSKDMLRVNFINVSNRLTFNENTISDSRRSIISQNSIAGAIHYAKTWNNHWQSSLELYETDYKLKAINSNVLESQRFLQENKVSETSFKLKTNYKLNDKINVLSGYHFVESEITNLDDVDTPIFRSLVSEVLRTHGVFTQTNYLSLNKRTTLSLGMRYNYLSKFKKQIWEPRFSFTHKLFKDFSVEILGETKHQNTSQIINFQNDFLGVEKRRWQLSNNADIPVIRSKQVSFGINYNKKGWQLGADIYYKQVKGITTQSQGFQNQYEFIKTKGRYKANGLDFILRKQLTKFNIWLSYAYLNSDYTFEKLPELSFRNNFDINHAISIGSIYKYKQLKVSSGINWFSGKPTTLPVKENEIIENIINFKSSNSDQLNHYFKVDVSALYDFKMGEASRVNVGVSVWNIFNKANEINNFFRIREGEVNEIIQTSLGINPNMILRIYF